MGYQPLLGHNTRENLQVPAAEDKMDILFILSEPKFWLSILFVALYALYRRGTSNYHLFKENGIPGPKPLPFIGNMWGVWNMTMWKEDIKRVNEYGKVVGVFEGNKPAVIVADPEIIKGILIKDFDHFTNHSGVGGSPIPIFSKMVFVLKDKEWKDVRSSITPAFSSGKIKRMAETMKEHVNKRALKLKKEARDGCVVDALRLFSEISLAVIGECAFGLKFNDLDAEDSEFVRHATNLLGTPEDDAALTSYFMLLPFLFPSMIQQYIGNNATYKYFMDLVDHLMIERSRTEENFNDFLALFKDLLSDVTLEANGNKTKRWTGEALREMICAQGLEFMIDGYAGTSLSLSYVAYRLAVHPDIQERLYNEIMDKLDTHGQVSHEMIHDIPYFDQFLNEVFRLHPIAPRIDRECCKDISYKGFNIKKGMTVQIPVVYLHQSEEYYSDPHTFNPDRWTPENKEKMVPYTYLPFGGGPRGCIGTRFAMEQMKIVISMLLTQFEFYPADPTMREMKYKPGYSHVVAPMSTAVGIRLRQESS